MQNKKIIVIVLALLLLLVLGLFLVKSNADQQGIKMADDETQTTSDKQQAGVDTTTTSGTGVKETLADLLKSGATQKCTFSNTTGKTTTSGITYIAGKQMRGDYDVVLEDGKKIQSHMISDGEWLYTWTSVLPQGMKIKIDESDVEKAEENISKVQGMENFQDKMNFTCSPWVSTANTFDLPSDVSFTDFSQTMEDIKSGASGTMCAACDMITDSEAKQECKTNLKCN